MIVLGYCRECSICRCHVANALPGNSLCEVEDAGVFHISMYHPTPSQPRSPYTTLPGIVPTKTAKTSTCTSTQSYSLILSPLKRRPLRWYPHLVLPLSPGLNLYWTRVMASMSRPSMNPALHMSNLRPGTSRTPQSLSTPLLLEASISIFRREIPSAPVASLSTLLSWMRRIVS